MKMKNEEIISFTFWMLFFKHFYKFIIHFSIFQNDNLDIDRDMKFDKSLNSLA